MYLRALFVTPAILSFSAGMSLRLAAAENTSPPFELFATSDLVRVFEDGYASPERLADVRVFGLRNETVSAQCAVKAHQDLENVGVSIGPFHQATGTGIIPSESVAWSFVESIFIEQNTPKLRKSDWTRVAPAWREASDFVHRHAPQLRRLDAIETTHCRDRLEIWIPKLDHLSTWQSAFEQAQREGNELWFYTVGIFQGGSLPNKTVDVPLIESRLMHWLNYRYGLKGYLHWGLNAWTDDPYRAPGRHRGDGWHVYPKKGGLLNSLRWEQMRNGLEDYECLWLLESKIAQIKATLSQRVAERIEPSRRGVEIATQVVKSYSDYTRDPAVLYAARRQAIEEAVALDAAPRVVLQTNPLELCTVANNCAIDVHGWVETGTKLKINGRPVSVAADGLFMAQLAPNSEGTIVLEAESGTARKKLARTFRLSD